MLIKFIIENYKSFKDKSSLLLTASSANDFEGTNVIQNERIRLLKSVVIYGANASGKSNLLEAFSFMKWFVINSSKNTQKNEPIGVRPFELNTATENAPSFFEVEFLIDKIRYRYGLLADDKDIHAEWLFEATAKKEYPVFVRHFQEIKVWEKMKDAKGLEKRTRHNSLFLSVAAQFNVDKASTIFDWFDNIEIVFGLDTSAYSNKTFRLLRDEQQRDKVINLIKSADLGIEHVEILENDKGALSEVFKKIAGEEAGNIILENYDDMMGNAKVSAVLTHHRKYDEKNNLVGQERFLFSEHESEGTQKYFDLLGVIIETIEKGKILIIDELDSRMHPLLTKSIIKLFNASTNLNSEGQLIFTTHDTNLLDNNMLRRDQIYFIEKNNFESSQLYSLVEFKTRKESPFDKNYLAGKYGAIPFINVKDLEETLL